MRIVFVTSDLEPGRCGVGDYARALAAECARRGENCALASLNDSLESVSARSDGLGPVLRLAAAESWDARLSRLRGLLDSFRPDWISLQFSCYGFAKRGLIFGLARRLEPLLRGRKLQLMFHELWIGAQSGDSLKDKLIGRLQRRLMIALVARLQPVKIHTSNPFYQALLAQNGVASGLLPLFGNIPDAGGDAGVWLIEELRRAGLERRDRGKVWLFGLFGSIPPYWPPEPLLSYLYAACLRQGRRGAIISAGILRGGSKVWDDMARRYAGRFVFLRLGEQPAARISQLLLSLDFGIATTTYALIGKSGSVAAMLEHGLPVLVNRDDFQIAGLTAAEHPFLHRIGPWLPEKLPELARRGARRSLLPSVAAQFLEDLSLAPRT